MDLIAVEDAVGAIVEHAEAALAAHHQHGMVGAADQVPQDHQVEIVLGEAGAAEHRHLGDRIILAIAAAPRERVGGGAPAVGDAILADVVDELDAVVDVNVDRVEPRALVALGQAGGECACGTAHGRMGDRMPASIERGMSDRKRDAVEDVGAIRRGRDERRPGRDRKRGADERQRRRSGRDRRGRRARLLGEQRGKCARPAEDRLGLRRGVE